VVALDPVSSSGGAEENSEATITQEVSVGEGGLVRSVTFTLTWTDEPDIQYLRTFENEPDQLGLEVTAPANPENPAAAPITRSTGLAANPQDGEGMATITFEFTPDTPKSQNGTGGWQVVVVCGDCGDFRTTTPSARYYQDTGNDYTLTIVTEMYTPKKA